MFKALSILSVGKIYMMPIILICDVWYASIIDIYFVCMHAMQLSTQNRYICPWLELEYSKGVIRICKSKKTDNTMAKRKRTKGQTTIYKTYTHNFFHPYKKGEILCMFEALYLEIIVNIRCQTYTSLLYHMLLFWSW